MKLGYVYILSNKNRTTLYVGLTSNLENRILYHTLGKGSAFTNRYGVVDLLYYESIFGMGHAIRREKQLKNWHRDWKWNLIKSVNEDLSDLANDWFSREELDRYRKADSETSLG